MQILHVKPAGSTPTPGVGTEIKQPVFHAPDISGSLAPDQNSFHGFQQLVVFPPKLDRLDERRALAVSVEPELKLRVLGIRRLGFGYSGRLAGNGYLLRGGHGDGFPLGSLGSSPRDCLLHPLQGRFQRFLVGLRTCVIYINSAFAHGQGVEGYGLFLVRPLGVKLVPEFKTNLGVQESILFPDFFLVVVQCAVVHSFHVISDILAHLVAKSILGSSRKSSARTQEDRKMGGVVPNLGHYADLLQLDKPAMDSAIKPGVPRNPLEVGYLLPVKIFRGAGILYPISYY